MNFVNDGDGIARCKGYGQSIMVLSDKVRRRCTVADKRRYGAGEIVTTLKYCYPVLRKFTRR